MLGWSHERVIGNRELNHPRFAVLIAAVLLSLLGTAAGCRPPADTEVPASPTATATADHSTPDAATSTGLTYTNIHVASVPWSVHVVTADRTRGSFELHSVHAGGVALGLGPLSRQLPTLARSNGTAVAAVNGDFYQRDRAYAGDPRGLQILEGELISAPNGGSALWIDAQAQPQAGPVTSRLEVTWPDGKKMPFGLNCDRRHDALVLYTASAGTSTHTTGGREFILERGLDGPENPWLPLSIGATLSARVRAVRDSGNAPITPDTLVLSAGPAIARGLDNIQAGAIVRIQADSVPSLAGARTAIGGGPVLVREGKRQAIRGSGESYETSSMFERHPRSAVGWDRDHFHLVEVDGRQPGLSMGMTLEELATWMARLGCQTALSLDGGGSATLWYDGRVRNSPCDGHERPIANGVVLVRKPSAN